MIGLFDSGVGGLTVVRELLKRSPHASFVYLGDTARAPYGNKSKDTLERYAVEDAAFLISHGATAIVVACNTASALAIDALHEAHPNVPIFEVITPAVEAAIAAGGNKIGVIGTRATIGSGVYQKELLARRSKLDVTTQACPLFVPLVEEGWAKRSETKRITKHYLYPMRIQHNDTLILGCTHYPLLASVIQNAVGRRVRLVDSASAVLDRVERERPDLLEPSEAPIQKFFFTDTSAHTDQIASRWLGRAVRGEHAELD